MKDSILKICVCFLSLFLLGMSCQRRGDIEFHISNFTSETLILKSVKDTKEDDTLTLQISGDENRRYIYTTRDNYPPPRKLKECVCKMFFVVSKNPAIKISKDIQDPNNWTKTLAKGKFTRSPDYTVCTFELNQSDIH